MILVFYIIILGLISLSKRVKWIRGLNGLYEWVKRVKWIRGLNGLYKRVGGLGNHNP